MRVWVLGQVHDLTHTWAGALGMLVSIFAFSLGPENEASHPQRAEGSDGDKQVSVPSSPGVQSSLRSLCPCHDTAFSEAGPEMETILPAETCSHLLDKKHGQIRAGREGGSG